MTTKAPHRRSLSLLAVIALGLSAAACGSALPHADIVAASRGNAQVGAAAPGTTSGGTTSQGGTTGTTSGLPGSTTGSNSGVAGGQTGPGAAATTGPGSSSGNGSTTADGDHTPIIIGSVGNYSGVPGAILKYEPITLQVWAKSMNAQGGVAGHPIQVIVVDDGSDPAHYQSAVRDLVENKHVIAFVDQGASQTADAAENYLESKRIPVVGAGDGNPAWEESWPYFDLQIPTPPGVAGDLAGAAKYQHATKIAVLACVEGAVCTTWKNTVPKYAPRYGMKVVYSASVSLTQPDYTDQCIQARRAGADLVIPVGDVGMFHRVFESCTRQGYKPNYVASAPTDLDEQEEGLDNVVGDNGAFPFDGIPGDPGSDEYLKAMKTYSPNTPLNIYTSLSWATAKLFQHVVEQAIGTGKPTSAKILEGLWAIKNFDVGGLSLPLNWPREKPGGGPPFCWFPLLFKGGHWTSPSNYKPVCDKP
ncbi:MAG: branched-chain amino acid transport system substrate-binding protein [Frankiaceae bacterium]|nr:branched-chain amino acid transport system substrate-binding protein [Frankiaceae bacterium]